MLYLYVLHCKLNKCRKKYLLDNKPQGIEYFFIECLDKGEFMPKRFYNYKRSDNRDAIEKIAHILIYNAKAVKSKEIRCSPVYDMVSINEITLEKLTPGELSLTNLSLNLKHRMAWARMLLSGAEYAIVVEDDIIYKESTIRLLHRIIASKMYRRYEYIDIAGGAALDVGDEPVFCRDDIEPNLYSVATSSTRTTCGYIINYNLAARLLLTPVDILFPIDFQLTYLFSILKTSVAWTKNPPFLHGSESGFYNSTNDR